MTRYRCCAHCVEDPRYHRENPPDSHTTTCSTGWRECDSGGDDPAPEPAAD